MVNDQYSALWVSHTTMKDYLYCPRAYYLKHIYKDPRTGHKIKIMIPPMALGQVVHQVLDEISKLPTIDRFTESLLGRFHHAWNTISGEKGGFTSPDHELKFKQRGEVMMQRLMDHPGPLKNPAVKMKEDLPRFLLSEEDNIILCGKVDWLEYLPETDGVHIIDFKTSTKDEDKDSLQLPIYHLLAHYCQKRKVEKVSYWYVDRIDGLVQMNLPDLVTSQQKILEIAQKIKVSKQLNVFKCPKSGCKYCNTFEKVLEGKGKFVGVDEFEHDIYILSEETYSSEQESVIL